jgi:uncharacterized membrane protein YoaK (UPF0700 family)
LRWLWGLVALLLAAGRAAVYVELPPWVGIILLSLAMGIMNTTITRVGGQPVSLGFITGDLNNLGRHLALAARGVPVSDAQGQWDTHRWRAAILLGIWAAFFLGAILAGALLELFGKWVLLPPIVVLAALAVWGGARAENKV